MRIAPFKPIEGTDLGDIRGAVDLLTPSYVVVPRNEMRMDETTGNIRVAGFDGPATEVALRELFWPVGLPFHYLRGAPNDVAAYNFNYWFPTAKGQIKLSIIHGNLVGILPERSTPIPHATVLTRLSEYLDRNEGGNGPLFRNYTLRNEDLRLRFAIPGETGRSEPKVGDVVECGLELTNHDSIKGYLDASSFFNRLVCTNGATVSDVAFSRRVRKLDWKDHNAVLTHAFEFLEEAYETVMAQAQALPTLTHKALPEFALTESEDDAEARKGWAHGVLLLGDVSTRFMSDLLDALPTEDATVFGLYNVLSRMGRDSADPTLRLRWEKAAGALLRPEVALKFAAV